MNKISDSSPRSVGKAGAFIKDFKEFLRLDLKNSLYFAKYFGYNGKKEGED